MSTRSRGWLVGACLTAALVAGLASTPAARLFAVPLGLLSLALSGLVAEIVAFVKASRGQARRLASYDPTPADGIVGITPLPSLKGRTNAIDPRWRCFEPGEPAEGVRNPRRDRTEGGSTLLGRVTIFSIFLGADARGWTDREIADGHVALERAGMWLEREAARHDAPIHVDLSEVYFRLVEDRDDPIELEFAWEGEEMGPLEANASTKYLAMASRAAAGLGFSDVADLQERVNALVEADRRVWLLHLRRAGRSIAIVPADSGLVGVGLAVCFAREASFPEPLAGPGRVDPTTVVHELLHLFGASDKYGAPLRSFPPRSVSSQDIMRLDHVGLHRMRVDRLTAREIGWNPTAIRGQRETRR